MAYLLGYIATDGNISNGHLNFGLQRKDEELLYKIKEELQFSGPIKQSVSRIKYLNKEYETSILNIANKAICDDLNSIGITENKSLTISTLSIPEEYEISFLLGVFDGDGSIDNISNTNTIRFRMCSASYNFIEYLRTLFIKHGFSDRKIYESKRKINSIYSLEYTTKDAIKFYTEAYKNSTIYLKRKHDKFMDLIDNWNKKH